MMLLYISVIMLVLLRETTNKNKHEDRIRQEYPL